MGNLPQIVVKIKKKCNHLQYITVFVVISSCVVFFLFFCDLTLPKNKHVQKNITSKQMKHPAWGGKNFPQPSAMGAVAPKMCTGSSTGGAGAGAVTAVTAVTETLDRKVAGCQV